MCTRARGGSPDGFWIWVSRLWNSCDTAVHERDVTDRRGRLRRLLLLSDRFQLARVEEWPEDQGWRIGHHNLLS